MEMLSQKSPATLLPVPWRGGISVLRSAGAEMIVVIVSFMHFSQPPFQARPLFQLFPKKAGKESLLFHFIGIRNFRIKNAIF